MALEIFSVGGALRDALLGQSVKDLDWVVVGATPQEMKAQGFQTVGKDFPVFLHPRTHEEYALARTERKTAPGYKGFVAHASPEVTLQEDLARRDLTVNAMALPQAWSAGLTNSPFNADDSEQDKRAKFKSLFMAHGIDPFHGLRDLESCTLRHVTPAFREDPVRILRVARFAAHLPSFSVAPETMTLMQEMVQGGEAHHLVPERVWQELAKGLMGQRPSRMFEVLRECGALKILLPEVERLWGVPQRAEHHPEVDTGVHLMMVLDMSARLQASLPVRLACLLHDLGKGTTPPDQWPRHLGHEQRSAKLLAQVCDRLKLPNDCRELADVVAREHGNIHRSQDLGAPALMRLLERCDAIRKPERWPDILLACACDARGRLGFEETTYAPAGRLLGALQVALSVETSAVAAKAQAQGLTGPAVGEEIHRARIKALAEFKHGAQESPSASF
jgi:tRNA nucleotidyltransferase (CCA-adding enzyme)